MLRKIIYSSFFVFIFFICTDILPQQRFIVNLNERTDDQFKVTLFPDNLKKENKVYNFAATAPGTYQLMNIGRYVNSFIAYDKDQKEIPVEKISENRWSISEPENVSKIVYSVSETWDTPVEEYPIYLMAGTSIEDDNVVINNQCVFGYFDGMQDYPINIKINYPDKWKVGTALSKNSEGYYEAVNYDYLVDSPIMLGRLSESSININGTAIDVYTYSKTDLIKSKDLLNTVKDILYAADEFTKGLPVDKYTFLFHFEDQNAGAWEHSYSSFYVFPEFPLNEAYKENIRSTVAHEFFHIVTPLNIHSELITHFNFSDPKLSKHIWFYEGVTEWASDALQIRGNIFTLKEYLNQLSTKLIQTESFNKDLSLTELSVNSFDLQNQFYLFYCKAPVIMTLLDIKLLEESNGKKGLRELINELAEDYGHNKSFNENNFFEELTNRTFPDVLDFLNKYIKGTEALPVKEYFNKVGINYYEYYGYDSTKIGLSFGFGLNEGKLFASIIYDDSGDIKIGDVFLKYNGREITRDNMGQIFAELNSSKPGAKVSFLVKRGSEEINVDYVLMPQKLKHIFKVNEKAEEEQLKLRKAWLKNL